MNNVAAIFKKQLKDTLKNKTVLIQFILFPVMTLIMNNAIKIQDMPENFFVNLFATMYIGMAPLTSISAIISEEKEKNTLRVLIMSNVKPYEYLLGVGSYVWFACMLGSVVICAAGGYDLQTSIVFMCIMAVGILTSLLIGAIIGVWSKTQMMATSVAVPVMMIFSFVPMLSLFNSTIEKMAKVIYSEQISRMLGQINDLEFDVMNVGVIGVNILIAAVIFVVIFKKSKLA
ncbi:MAG: ABC transporter permease [Lachnospiraceae bacterium]|nr:ABC transporter permease [Lachnospiraceae bacterium]